MSFQEEMLKEIADAIREVEGTEEKIPANQFASRVAGLSVVKPSGTITIKENGSHNVANYEWAEVSVEADLNERVIIGKWVNANGLNYVFQTNGVFYIHEPTYSGTYTIEGFNIYTTSDVFGETETVLYVYDEETDTIVQPDTNEILTRVEQTANLITKEVTENGTYKASDEGVDGYSEVVVDVVMSAFDRVFSKNTPEQIEKVANEISAKGMTSAEVEATYGWKIGDTKDITLTTGEVIQMRIIGFNHDNLTGGGKAGITLDMVNCLNTKYKMNSTNTNAGGWEASQFRNTTLPTIKATLPTEWQNIIVKVDKKSANGGGTNFSAVVTTSDDLFLLSEVEMSPVWGSQNGTEEGGRYEYWLGIAQSDRYKLYDSNADGVPDKKETWRLRSCFNNSTTNFTCVGANGYSGTGADAYNITAISFAFCVGSSPVPVIAGLPIEATTDTEMTTALTQDNLGKVYKFTGTSDTYETDAIYIVSEVE